MYRKITLNNLRKKSYNYNGIAPAPILQLKQISGVYIINGTDQHWY